MPSSHFAGAPILQLYSGGIIEGGATVMVAISMLATWMIGSKGGNGHRAACQGTSAMNGGTNYIHKTFSCEVSL
jgi:hypothetical protein